MTTMIMGSSSHFFLLFFQVPLLNKCEKEKIYLNVILEFHLVQCKTLSEEPEVQMIFLH